MNTYLDFVHIYEKKNYNNTRGLGKFLSDVGTNQYVVLCFLC